MLWMVCLFLSAANARLIKSSDEARRLEGFWSHKIEIKQFDEDRQRGLNEFLRENSEFERQREKALEPFLREKQRQRLQLSESSKLYQQWQKEVLKREDLRERARQNFLAEQARENSKAKIKVNVTVEQELNLVRNAPRVDWSKRRFSSNASGAGGRGSGSESNFSQPPVNPIPGVSPGGEGEFASPPPDYFESDAPPPPPLPPELYDPDSGNFVPPPVEDFVPPPVE